VRVRVLATAFLGAVLCVVFVVAWLRGGLREELAVDGTEQGTDCRQTGNHDADVRFYSRPVSDRQVVPCNVVRVRKLDEILQTQYADDGDTRMTLERSGQKMERNGPTKDRPET